MSSQVQTVLCTISINIAKKFGAGFLFVPANSEAGDAAALIADREPSYPLCFQGPELTYRIENPEQRRAEVLLAPFAATLQTFENGIEILLAPQAHSNGYVNLGMLHILRFELFHEPIGNQLIVFRRL